MAFDGLAGGGEIIDLYGLVDIQTADDEDFSGVHDGSFLRNETWPGAVKPVCCLIPGCSGSGGNEGTEHRSIYWWL